VGSTCSIISQQRTRKLEAHRPTVKVINQLGDEVMKVFKVQ
jgi:hypothetical protein